MFELLKLAWNALMLRDSIDKGEMTPGVWMAAASFLGAMAIIGFPTVYYYDHHPDAPPTMALVALGLAGICLIVFLVYAIRWRMKLSRRQRGR